MNSKPAWVCALSTFILAGTAHAQTAPAAGVPQQYLAHISIHAEPSTQLEIVPSEGWQSEAVAQCTEYCDFWALPGRYTLYALDNTTGERKQLSLRVKHSTRFELEPGDDSARSSGLALGIAGSAAIVTGLILLTAAMMSGDCPLENCSSDGRQTTAIVGLSVFVGGALATPAGWIMYASNRTRLKPIDDRPYPATETSSRVRVGLVGVGSGGLGLGGVASF